MQKYKLTSIIDSFIKADREIRLAKSANKKFQLWKKLFERSHKDIFNTYYRWGHKKYWPITFKNYDKKYKPKCIKINEVETKKLIPQVLNKLSKVIKSRGSLPIMLFVGLSLTNGFVDKYKKKYTTFLNLEQYDDSFTLKVFLAHELTHCIHLQNNPSIYYWHGNKVNWYNALVLEGVATYLTKKILKISSADALWGNYLNKKERADFVQWCEKNKVKLKQQLLRQIDKTKKEESQFFGGKKPRGCPYYRTGYFLGLDLVENLLQKMKLKEVIMLKGAKLRKEILDYLQN